MLLKVVLLLCRIIFHCLVISLIEKSMTPDRFYIIVAQSASVVRDRGYLIFGS